MSLSREEMFEIMRANPAIHLATLDGDQPRVRCVFLYSADEKGIVFHTGAMKDLHRQIQANPKVEMCFNDFAKNVQVRVTGVLREADDNDFKDEICNHPSRAFLKPWRESGPLADFYSVFKVYRLENGTGVGWSMEENFAPKQPVAL